MSSVATGALWPPTWDAPYMPQRLSKAEHHLRELVKYLDRARDALSAFEARGDAPVMVEGSKLAVRRLQSQIRSHCGEHGLPLPPNAGLEEDE